MVAPNEKIFLQLWPRCFLTFMAIIELITVIILVLTEIGNVAANFWTTNVFAGGWCGLVMLVHLLFLFVAGCCAPGLTVAFHVFIVTILGLLASALLISFDAAFIVRPTTCILTSTCTANAASNATFSYNFRKSFFMVFNNVAPFKSYSETQAKLLFQSIQIGSGCLCFILCIIYIIVYYVCTSKSKPPVKPTPQPSQQKDPYGSQQGFYSPLPGKPPPPSQHGFHSPLPGMPPPPPQQGYYSMSPPPPPPGQQAFYTPPPSLLPPPPPPQPVPAQQGYYPPPPPHRQLFQPPAAAWRPPPRLSPASPSDIVWNVNRKV